MDDTELLQAVLAGVLRKYVPRDKKIEIDLVKLYNETILDINIADNGLAKISWRFVDVTLE